MALKEPSQGALRRNSAEPGWPSPLPAPSWGPECVPAPVRSYKLGRLRVQGPYKAPSRASWAPVRWELGQKWERPWQSWGEGRGRPHPERGSRADRPEGGRLRPQASRLISPAAAAAAPPLLLSSGAAVSIQDSNASGPRAAPPRRGRLLLCFSLHLHHLPLLLLLPLPRAPGPPAAMAHN